MQSNNGQRYFDTFQAARYMGLSPATLNKWRSVGNGPAYYKCHGRVLYTESDITDFVIERRVRSTAEYRR